MPLPLTQNIVDKAKANIKRKMVADGACKGLYLDVRPNGKSYRYRFTDNRGVHRAVTIGDAEAIKLSEARDKALEFRRDRILGTGICLEEPKDKCPTFEHFVRQIYMPNALTTRRAADQDWGLFLNHLFPVFGPKRLHQITRSDIALFMQVKRNDGYMSSTCNRLLARLKAVLSYAMELEVTGFDKNPARGYKQYKEPPHKDRFLTPEEAERLLMAVRESDSPFLEFIIPFLLLTGARKSEAQNACWECLDWQARRWLIPITKNGKARHVPLSDGAIKVLLMVRAKHEELSLKSPWVFPNPETGMPYSSIYYPWNVARKKAGLEDVRIHDLRHSFASALVNRGMTLYDIKEILGHSNIATTQRYAHLSQERLMEAVSHAEAHYQVHRPLPIQRQAIVHEKSLNSVASTR